MSEKLWEVIGPLLPAEPPKPKGGRPRIPDRAVLASIVYVFLKSGVPWSLLPKELGCGSGATYWRGASGTGRELACGAGCIASCSTSTSRCLSRAFNCT